VKKKMGGEGGGGTWTPDPTHNSFMLTNDRMVTVTSEVTSSWSNSPQKGFFGE